MSGVWSYEFGAWPHALAPKASLTQDGVGPMALGWDGHELVDGAAAEARFDRRGPHGARAPRRRYRLVLEVCDGDR